jgi:ligand-binding sensor domain-containing protein
VNRGGLLLLALGVADVGPVAAQARFWREDERVIITDQQTVYAVAATDARVYAATTTGLAIYDRRFRQWEPPVTVADGYPLDRISAALADPADDAVWLGTATGVVRYRPVFRSFDGYPVPGGVRDLAFDRDDAFQGIYLRSAAGWQLLTRGGFSPVPATPPPPGRRIAPLRPEQLEARIPYLRTMGQQALLDERLRQFHFTSGAAVPGTEEYYLGTDGMGLVFVDALVAQIEPLPAGLLSPGAGAVLTVQDGVWVGSDHQGARTGLTFVSDDLQRYAYEEGPRGTGFRASVVRALAARGGEIWAGTDQGIVRVEPGVATRRLQAVDGLPDDEVFALATGPAGTWVATARGVARVPPDTVLVVPSEGPSVPALGLALARDSAWVAYTDGLGLAAPDGQVFFAPGSDTLPELRDAIVAVATLGDTVIAATVDRLLWRAGAGPWVVGRALSEVAPIYALAGDASGLWVGGGGGLAHVRLAAGAVVPFPAPRDVPAAVRGIALSERYLWLATEAGLVRFSRNAITP